MAETILIVDDEEPVRRTFQEWLEKADPSCEVLVAADAETALNIANQRPIDVAILDWNLGAGNNGLQLLEDLYVFNPDVVAIMITGYAHQATPLDAMRMGVRDYLDKNQDLQRNTLLSAVRKQLERIRPAKRERLLQKGLAEFRSSVEKILPLVRTTAAMTDPVPLTDAIRSLFRFLQRTTNAEAGALVVRSYDPQRDPAENYRAYSEQGEVLKVELVPFARSLAGAVASRQEVSMTELAVATGSLGVQLQPFEKNRRQLLALPITIGSGVTAVLELFDKRDGPFTDADRRLVGAAADFAAALMKQALAERQTHGTLLGALESALHASQQVTAQIESTGDKPPPAVMAEMQRGLVQTPTGNIAADDVLQAAELLRVIAQRHGPQATKHCIDLLRTVDQMLAEQTKEI